MPYVSQLAFYDTGLKNWSPDRDRETSQDSQRVLYEGHNPINYNSTEYKLPLIAPGTKISIPWGYTDSSLELSPDTSASTSCSSAFIQPDPLPGIMQNITKYSGESGAVHISFIREIQAVYNRMLRTPAEHTIDGFGEWEFINLLQGILKGEVRDVLAGILDRWDFNNPDNENWEAANDAERRR